MNRLFPWERRHPACFVPPAQLLLLIIVLISLLSVRPLHVSAYSESLQASELDACFSALSKFDHGKDVAPLRKLSAYAESLAANSKPAQDLEARLVGFLDSNASVAARQFACRQLGLIGGEASLPVLQKLLSEPSMSEIALWALERIPGSDATLRKSLAVLTGTERMPIIAALGRRHDTQAVALLQPIIADKDPGVAEAAIHALGLIGTSEAAKVLLEARHSASGKTGRLLGLSLVQCGEGLASKGQPGDALLVFRELVKSGEDRDVRFGALQGLSGIPGSDVVSNLVAFIKSEDQKTAASAIHVLLRIPGSAPVENLTNMLPGLQPATQRAALLALEARRDAKAAIPAVVEASRSRWPEVRSAAWTALGTLGDSSHVRLLVKALLASDPGERTAARLSLAGMNCPDFDHVLLDLLQKADSDTKVEIVGIIDERRMTTAADLLMSIATKENNSELRSSAFRALRRTATESQIQRLVDLLATDSPDFSTLAETVSSLLKRFPQPHVGYVCRSYGAVADAPRRTRLIAGLRGVGDPEALRLLKEALSAKEREIQRSAILSLSDWPDPAPLPDLIGISRQSALDRSLRTLALRGCLKLLTLPSTRTHDDSVSVIRQVLELAPAPEEKRRGLALLERFPGPQALALAETARSDSAIAAEANSAIERLRAEVAAETRLLVYTRNYASQGEVYVHDNIASSVAAIERLGLENGFSIDVSDHPAVFTDENLGRYKAIVFSNSNNEAFENDEQRAAFQRYVRKGGAFVGIHAACASEPKWRWFWSLVGGTFDFHPPFQRFSIRVLDRAHPSTAFFSEGTWSWEDEFYFLKERSDKVRVLLAGEVKSLKNRGDNSSRLDAQPEPSPLVWCQEFEGGRVWYTALGHKKEHYQDPVYLKHLLGGILWAIGRN